MAIEISVFVGVILFGLLHGLEPGHGWPFAFLYSIKQEKPMKSALLSSVIIAISHFISSIAVVVVYFLISANFTVPSDVLRYITTGLLIVLAIIFWFEKTDDIIGDQHEHLHENKEFIKHEHEHKHLDGNEHIHEHSHAKSVRNSLAGLASFALLIGFVHAEEFMLIDLFLEGYNPWFLTISYATAVTISLMGITLICTKFYQQFLPKFTSIQDKIPKISAIILLIMALGFAFDVV